MTIRTNTILAAALAAGAAFAGALALAGEDGARRPRRKWQDVPQPPLRKVTPPAPVVATLANGMKVFLLEDRELPTIDIVLHVRAGEIDLPSLYPGEAARGKAGLASLAGQLIRAGGTASIGPDELDDRLDGIAASISTSCGFDEGTARLSCLTEDLDEALALFADVVRRPAFREDRFALAKRQRLGALRRRDENPAQIASREFARLVYGDMHPLGWTDEPESIGSITRDDVVRFYEAAFAARPGEALLGAVGDFDAAAMKEKLAAAFGDWKPDPSVQPAAPRAVPTSGFAGPAPKVYFIAKPDVNQSTVILGHAGVQRRPDDPDLAPAVVANFILGGGGFASRLMQRVRTEMGLAYGCRSSFDAAFGHQGTFILQGQTKSGSTLAMARAMRKELERLVSEPPTAEELRVAKNAILEQAVFEYDQKREILDRALRYELHGFPRDELERFQRAVAAVTAEDCLRVAKKLFRPERLATLVVGNEAEFDGKLAEIGEVVPIALRAPTGRGRGAIAETGDGRPTDGGD